VDTYISITDTHIVARAPSMTITSVCALSARRGKKQREYRKRE